jgi:hypothetical protein
MDGEEQLEETQRKGALAAAAAVGRAVDDLAELNMDAYDDEPDSGFDLFIDNGMAYRDQKEDPYLLPGADVRIPPWIAFPLMRAYASDARTHGRRCS